MWAKRIPNVTALTAKSSARPIWQFWQWGALGVWRQFPMVNTETSNMSDRPENVGVGALFKNDRKEKPSQPDYRGDITILGEKYLLAGWIKQGKKGKYLSIVARPDEQEREQASQERAGDAIPF